MAEGTKHDIGKLRYDLVPYDSLAKIVEIFNYGANKYDDRNWEKGMSWGRLFAATLRHLTKWWMGEKLDPESGLHHLAHAGCNILFLLAYDLRKIGEDDRKVL